MNNGGIYFPELFDSFPPANVRGGVSRAKSARRDAQGRFLPNTETFRPLDPEHGVKASKIRAMQAKRNEKGRYTK